MKDSSKRLDVKPNRAGVSFGAPSTLITARSSGGNVLTRLTWYCPEPLENRTWKLLSAPTMCAFVTTCPSPSSTTPDPRPLSLAISTTDGNTWSTTC